MELLEEEGCKGLTRSPADLVVEPSDVLAASKVRDVNTGGAVNFM